jgi:hypothetical protein
VAAVAVLAVGGTVVGQALHGRGQAVGPAGQVPDPAPLTAQSLSAATTGWIAGWTTQEAANADIKAGPVEHCLNKTPTAHAEGDQTRASGNQVFISGDTAAVAALVGFDDSVEPNAIWSDVTTTFDACSGSTPTGHLSWDGAKAQSYDLVSAGGGTEHFWIVQDGSTIGFMWVTAEPTGITTAADAGVARALVSALEFPGSMKSVSDSSSDSPSSSSSSSSSSTASISSVDLGEAVGDWHSGWSATGGKGDASTPPCGVQLQGAQYGSGSSLGSNGDQETYGFAGSADASSALADFTSRLAACSSASYTVTTVPSSYGNAVTVATGSGQGADVIWMVQSGRQIAYAAVPAGDGAPPASVSKKIGDLLVFGLKANADSSDPSANSGPVEQKDATSPATQSGRSGG